MTMTMEMSFYQSLIYAFTVITIFACVKMVVGSLFRFRFLDANASMCVVLGCLLGIFIATPLNRVSRGWGFFGIGLGIGLAFILGYTRVIGWLIERIPARLRNAVRTVFRVIRVALIVVLIIGITMTVLAFMNS